MSTLRDVLVCAVLLLVLAFMYGGGCRDCAWVVTHGNGAPADTVRYMLVRP